MTLLLASSLPAQRATAVRRGMDFIVSIARNPTYFADYGDDLLWCLYVNDSKVVGNERALKWRRLHPALPANASADEVATLLFGSYAADLLGVPDDARKEQLRISAARFSALDYLLFDPRHEPPPADIPEPCGKCHAHNERGAQVCHQCGAGLTMRSRYDVFCDALVTTYTGDRIGVTLGAPWTEVIKWLAAMRPYRGRTGNPEFQDMLYAVTTGAESIRSACGPNSSF